MQQRHNRYRMQRITGKDQPSSLAELTCNALGVDIIAERTEKLLRRYQKGIKQLLRQQVGIQSGENITFSKGITKF